MVKQIWAKFFLTQWTAALHVHCITAHNLLPVSSGWGKRFKLDLSLFSQGCLQECVLAFVPAGHFKGPVDLTGKDHSALSLTELQSWRSKASFIQQIVCSTYRVPPARLLCPPHYWLPAGVLRVGDVWDRRRWLQIHPQCQSIIFDSTHDNAYINFQIFFRARACLCVLRCLSYVMNMSPTYTICGV